MNSFKMIYFSSNEYLALENIESATPSYLLEMTGLSSALLYRII
jgi:hypothetical protein